MRKYQNQIIVAILCLIFTTLFLFNTKSDFPWIFKKDLLAHDESSNSVVAANLTRKLFPPMVRVNPLVDQEGNWMEGPYWQHIPPLFAYVPYLFFNLDGQVSIEVKRLSYAFVLCPAGLLFICGIYRFRQNLSAALAATIAAIFWLNTPFTHELISGYAFGASDIVLAFTVVFGFLANLWYLEKDQELRLNYPIWKFALIGLVVALPVMAKNLLGAIPAATFFGLLIWDHRTINKKVSASVLFFLFLLLVCLLPLFFSSPQTFKSEIFVSFTHFRQLEGWARPWHWYLSDYLPQRYLFRWTWVYYAGITLGIVLSIKYKGERKDKILLGLSGGWFVWNLLAISLVTSKVPNFIYQSYLLSLFFILYALTICVRQVAETFRFRKLWKSEDFRYIYVLALSIALLVTGYESVRFDQAFKSRRAQAYIYQSEHEKFYRTAEEMRALGLTTNDLIIVRVSDSDCWFRYYPLFLTGTESKTLLEMNFGFDPNAIKQKYSRMFFVINKTAPSPDVETHRFELTDYSMVEFDLSSFTSAQIQSIVRSLIDSHQADIQLDISRIKKDKTSCQWLVPDPILNAP
ncbi:MAG: hypothetical protein ABI643_02490 [Candidatus Doudnabacteria bacterium]